VDGSGPVFDIICIGASAGGVEPLKQIVRRLSPELPAAVCVVLHVPESGTSVLPSILARAGPLPASHAVDGEAIRPGHIYVAPPGYHLAVDPRRMRLLRGARENAHRPAIDPLFRSAALAFSSRAIGVVLSGLLDDGTIGLREIKRAGGIAVVQDPADTEWSSMPMSALANVSVDYRLPAREIGDLLVHLVAGKEVSVSAGTGELEQAAAELRNVTMQTDERDKPGRPSPYSCPECGGVLWEMQDGELLRFRCRVGHAYTSDALTTQQADTIEKALWTALRALEEQSALKRRLAERARMQGNDARAKQLEERSELLAGQSQQVRELLLVGVGAEQS
jgi:two-component system, chemotaxis family, protein-glutamate methylesterase/glutaminase